MTASFTRPMPCPRCGVLREARVVSRLCRSCHDVLTKTERKAW